MNSLSRTTIVLFLFMLTTFNPSIAQELKRKASLGIIMQPLNDSLVASFKLQNNKGIFISDALPNSTAENIGMVKGAVLRKLNGISVNSNEDVLELLTDFRANDTITVEYVLNGKVYSKTTLGIGRVKEDYKNANIIYDQVVYKDNKLRSILYTPKNKSNPPVVFYLQGYTCGSFEFSPSSQHASLKLIHDWVDAGFAVYRIEKPGVGDSESKVKCINGDFSQELTAYKEGYKALLKSKLVDVRNIFLFGHSMGGIIAPLLHDLQRPRGIITYGIISKPWYEYMKDIYTIQPKIFGTPQSQIDEDSKIGLAFLHDMLQKKLPVKELIKNETYRTYLGAQIGELEKGSYLGRDISYWQTLCDIDIPNAWRRVTSSVLAMHGEYDIQAIDDTGAKGIVALVANKTNATFKLVPKTEHGFIKFTSMQANVDALQNGTYGQHFRNNYNTEVSRETIDWINSNLE